MLLLNVPGISDHTGKFLAVKSTIGAQSTDQLIQMMSVCQVRAQVRGAVLPLAAVWAVVRVDAPVSVHVIS